MFALFAVGCALFVPESTDAPPARPPAPAPNLTPAPVPRDTGDPSIAAADISGDWQGPCSFEGYGGYSSALGGSGSLSYPTDSGYPYPSDSDSYGYGAQSAFVTMTLVEVASGAVFGGAEMEIRASGDDLTLSAGVSGTRDADDRVELDLSLGFAAASFTGAWDKTADLLVGTLTFPGYGATASCIFAR